MDEKLQETIVHIAHYCDVPILLRQSDENRIYELLCRQNEQQNELLGAIPPQLRSKQSSQA